MAETSSTATTASDNDDESLVLVVPKNVAVAHFFPAQPIKLVMECAKNYNRRAIGTHSRKEILDPRIPHFLLICNRCYLTYIPIYNCHLYLIIIYVGFVSSSIYIYFLFIFAAQITFRVHVFHGITNLSFENIA